MPQPRLRASLIAAIWIGGARLCGLLGRRWLQVLKSPQAMPLYWLVYRHNNQISVVIEPGASLIHARMRVALANLDEGEFTEGHELPGKWKLAKEMVGRWLSQEEAKRLLAKFALQVRRVVKEIGGNKEPRRSGALISPGKEG